MRVLNRTATRATGARVALRRAGAVMAVAATAAALSVTSAPLAAAAPALTGPTLQTVTFTSPASVASWTAPGDASTTVELMISATGGQGGRGGYDGGTTPAPGGYVGVVSGTVTVPGGTTLQIAVGAGGAGGANSATNGPGGNGGANTFGGYAGGKGGTTGSLGTSGAGGGGGAATVIKLAGRTVVAGGAGGGGGSGNGGVLTGRAAEAAFSPDHASGNTNGTVGASVPTSGNQLDGGGAGGGGGGESGGAGGHIEYGSGLSMEWFGYGGYPGGNATGGYSTLDGSYQYYSGNGANGSVTIKYVDGPPAPAQNVIGKTGTAAGSVELSWQAPVNSGLTAVTGYKVQVSPDGGTTWQDAVLAAGSPAVTADGGKATVTGLTGSEEYTFRVAAQNGYDVGGGLGGWSVPSAAVTAAAGGGDVPDSPWGADGGDAGDTGAENAHVVPGDGTITVTWDDGTAPAEYTVHVYDEHGDEAGSSPRTCAGGDCTVSGLDPEGDYTVVIETPGAETDPAVTVGPHQPDPNVQPAPGDWNGANVTRKSDGSIEVAWPAPAVPPADSYRLYVYDASGDPLDPPVTQDCSAASCTVGGLDPDLDYQIAYSVLTPGENESDPLQEGTPSSTVTVSAYDDDVVSNTTPSGWTDASGENSVITRNDDGTITVDWTSPASPPNSDYLLHVYDEDGEVAGSPFPCTGGQSCTSGYLDPGTTYEVTVEVPHRTAPSPEVTTGTDQTWTDPQDPARVLTGPPTNLGTTARDRALAVSFTAPAAQPAGNQILYYQYSLDGGATWANSGAFASPANVSGLVNGTAYSVQLRAMTLQGPGVASAAVAGTPRSYPSAPYSGSNPAGISVVSRSGGSVTVNWDPYSPNGAAITSYTLTAFNAATAGSASGTCSVAPPAHSCTINGLSATGTYYLSVQAQNAVGASPRSDPRIKLVMNATAPGKPGQPALAGGKLGWTAPTVDAGHGTPTAYEVQYSTDGGTTWVTVTPSSLDMSGSPVTAAIGSLPGAGSYLFRTRALADALAGEWSDASAPVTVATAPTPAFSSPISTPGGYTVQITNYDAALGWSASVASPGSATIDGSGKVTVTGLSASQSATVTVTATGFGTAGRSASTSGTALGGTAPILSAATPIDKGFTVQIVNWSEYKNGRYGPHTVFTPVVVANPNGVTPTYSGPDATGLVTVTGIGDAHQITLAYKVASDTHTEMQSDGVVGKSLLAAAALALDVPVAQSGGFAVNITDATYDGSGATTYQVKVTDTAGATIPGAQVSRNGKAITVSGLGAGVTARVTVTSQKDGSAPGSAYKDGTSLAAGPAPTLGLPTRLSAGFTAQLWVPADYSPRQATVMVSGGASVSCGGAAKVNGPITCGDGSTVTVSGLASGATATVTAIAWDASHAENSNSVTGQALFAGVAPEFGPTHRIQGAFGFQITNWNVFQGSDAGNGTDPNRTSAYRSSDTLVAVGFAGTDSWTACTSSSFNGDLSAIPSDNGPVLRCSVTGQVGVGGLNDGQSKAIEVKVIEVPDAHSNAINHAPAVAVRNGSAPTTEELTKLINLTPTADGFTVDIEGYPASLTTYTVALVGVVPDGATVTCGESGPVWTAGAPVTCADGHILVTGLAPGEAATVHVEASHPDIDPMEFEPVVDVSEVTGTALRDDLTLSFGTVTRTAGGFEFPIGEDVYDDTGTTRYSVTLAAVAGSDISGAQVARNGRFIVVTGLAAGAKAEVTVTAEREGSLPASSAQQGQAKDDGVKPGLALGQRLPAGFTATISNQSAFSAYDAGSRMVTVMVSGGATVQCGSGGGDKGPRVNGPVVCALTDTITVSGVASGGVATVTAAVIDKDHVDVVGDGLTGQARFAGVAPEFGEVTRTEHGFTTSVSNWDVFLGTAADGYPGADPRTSAYTGELFVTMTAAVQGVSGSQPTVQCGTSGVSAANGSVVCAGNGAITVTGLTAEQQAIVTVTVTESDGNHTDSSAARQGQALATGISPAFDQATSLVKSFTVRIANYDATSSYTITATEGTGGSGTAIPAKNVSFNSGTHLITVTGLADGAQATVRVQVAAAGKLPAEASHTGTALKAPVTPILAVTANTATGFTVAIVNGDAFSAADYGSGTTFVPVVTPQGGDTGVHVDANGDGTFTVSGVPTGHTATLKVTVKQAEHPDATSDGVTGTALYAGVAPTLGSPTRTADGFRVPITNYALYTADGDPTVDGDDGSRYGDGGQFAITVTAVSPGGTALGDVKAIVLQPDGILQVSGLAYGQTATVELTAGDGLTKHQDATSDAVEGQALSGPIPASFGQVTATLDSITVRITNFDSNADYVISSSAGVASRSGSVITVTGLQAGQSATITVNVTPAGHVSAVSSTSGTALKAQDQPGSSSATQRLDGFTAKIVPFDKEASYSAAISGAPGASVKVSGDTVTVTGMKPSDTVTVTITQTKDGYAPVTTTITYTLPADAGTAQDPSGGATPPAVPELKPGQTAVTVNGVPVPSQTTVGPGGVTVTWQGMTMTAVRIESGNPVPPGTDGSPDDMLTVPFTGYVKVDVSGFAPHSRVQLWAFSTPTLLGTFTAEADTRGLITVHLPRAVIVGDHTLVAAGVNRAGEQITMSTAMRVTPLAGETGMPDPDATAGREEIAYTGTRTFDELRIAAGLLVVGMGLVALSYRRRRPDPALAQIGVAGGFGPEPESSGSVVVAYGTWRRSPDSGAAAAAVSAAMTAIPSSVEAVTAAGTAAIPAQRATVDSDPAMSGPVESDRVEVAPVVDAAPAPEAPSPQPGHRFIAPRTAPSVEWMSLRFSLGLTQG